MPKVVPAALDCGSLPGVRPCNVPGPIGTSGRNSQRTIAHCRCPFSPSKPYRWGSDAVHRHEFDVLGASFLFDGELIRILRTEPLRLRAIVVLFRRVVQCFAAYILLPKGSLSIQTEMSSQCSHLDEVRDVSPKTDGCEECLKMGDEWVHLRMCLLCGHVGCCDSSKNKHATRHYGNTGHPLMRSLETGENWGWCYVDELEIAV